MHHAGDTGLASPAWERNKLGLVSLVSLVSPPTKRIILVVSPAPRLPSIVVTRQVPWGHPENSRASSARHTKICVARASRHAAKPPTA